MGGPSPPSGRRGDAAESDPPPAPGSIAQLTPRALITGALIGGVTGVSNLYIGLKLGWSLGVVITACVVGWSVWRGAQRLGLMRTSPTILEAGAMASTASGAGYSTGTTLASAISAWLLVTGEHLPLWQLIAWILAVSALGVAIAMALRRRLIDTAELPFPTAAAAASMLQSLVTAQDHPSTRARVLLRALLVGVTVQWMAGVMPIVNAHWGLPSWLALPAALPTADWMTAIPALATVGAYGFSLELSVLLPAAGALAGWRVGASLLLGAVLCFGLAAPALAAAGATDGIGYAAVVKFSVWPGATLMTVGGLATVVLRPRPNPAPSTRTRAWVVPGPRIVAGLAASGLACVVLLRVVFEVGVAVGLLAVVAAIAFASVAARITGETDITPTGPLGKVAQLGFGTLTPAGAAPNVLVAGVTAGAASSAADLLTDLKVGAHIGANPRRQTVAQACGVVVGALVVVPVFRYVLVPDPTLLGTAQWPAPAAQIWASVARLFAEQAAALPPGALAAMALAAATAVILVGAQRAFPRYATWIPNATALGLALVLPPAKSIGMFLGAAAVAIVLRRRSTTARDATLVGWIVPAASGLIAGESLVGVVQALLTAAG